MPHYHSTEEIAARYANMRYSGKHRRFLVNRMGNTGSTWLAKLLNAHPDVFCEHEGLVSRIWPRVDYAEDDILRYIEHLAAYEFHEAYKAIGDVGSVWLNHVVLAPPEAFATAILTRHPVRILNTRLRQVRAGHTEFTDLAEAEIEQLFGLKPADLEPADLYFVNDCAIFLSVAEHFDSVGSLIQIEKFSELDYATDTLKQLTGLDYPAELIQELWFQRVNTHNNLDNPKAVFDSFSEWQRGFYLQHIDLVADTIGYRLEDDTPAVSFSADMDLTEREVKPLNSGRVDRNPSLLRITTSGLRGDYAACIELDAADVAAHSLTVRIEATILQGALEIVVQRETLGDGITGQTIRASDQNQTTDLIISPASDARRVIFRNDTKDGTPTIAQIHRVELGRLQLDGWPAFQPR